MGEAEASDNSKKLAGGICAYIEKILWIVGRDSINLAKFARLIPVRLLQIWGECVQYWINSQNRQ